MENLIIKSIYSIILLFFLVGGVGFYFINKKKDAKTARNNRVKLFTYFAIINIIFFSITLNPLFFRALSVLIAIAGAFELIRLFRESHFKHRNFFYPALLLYLFIALHFWRFSLLPAGVILFTFIVLSAFDSFSQISGQLWGSHKIFPKISPNKTIEGAAGGAIMAMFTGFLLRSLFTIPGTSSSLHYILLAALISLFALIGDFLASYFKRKYQVKDYSNLIPGHGGILDRFDSLITAGALTSMLAISMFT